MQKNYLSEWNEIVIVKVNIKSRSGNEKERKREYETNGKKKIRMAG